MVNISMTLAVFREFDVHELKVGGEVKHINVCNSMLMEVDFLSYSFDKTVENC